MAGVITTGNHPKALWPGIHAWFGLSYNTQPTEYTDIFDTKTSDQNYEEDVEATGFGLAPIKAEGGSVNYDSHNQGPTTRYTHTAYGLGYIVTEEEEDDGQYPKLSRSRAESLAFSMRTTKEIVGALVLDRAFTAGYTGGDGSVLCVTSHTTLDGTQSNTLNTPADFSETSLEDMLIAIGSAKNTRGLPIAIRARRLIIPINLLFDVKRVLLSDGQSGTPNNDINASKGMISDGYAVNHYVTDTDAWFIKTDVPNGMTHFQRKALAFTQDSDFDTANKKHKAMERYSFKWSDFRGLYGSPGV